MKTPTHKTSNENHDQQDSPEQLHRGFLKQFCKYAVSTPAVTFTLMSPMTSKAITSGGIVDDSVGDDNEN